MLLQDQHSKDVLSFIIASGKEDFLNSLCVKMTIHGNINTRCPICTLGATTDSVAWMISDSNGKPVFQDRFDESVCAEIAMLWLRRVLTAYEEFLVMDNMQPKTYRNKIIPSLSSLEKFKMRRCGHVANLQKFSRAKSCAAH